MSKIEKRKEISSTENLIRKIQEKKKEGDKWVEKVLEMAGASEPARDLRYPIVDGEKD